MMCHPKKVWISQEEYRRMYDAEQRMRINQQIAGQHKYPQTTFHSWNELVEVRNDLVFDHPRPSEVIRAAIQDSLIEFKWIGIQSLFGCAAEYRNRLRDQMDAQERAWNMALETLPIEEVQAVEALPAVEVKKHPATLGTRVMHPPKKQRRMVVYAVNNWPVKVTHEHR